jgi:hypothetical protein
MTGKRLLMYKAIISLLFFTGLIKDVYCQNNTLYLMPSVPQANQLNPALRHPCRIYIALPVISSLRQSTRNTGFGFHDAIHTGTGTQSGIYYLDPDNLEKKMGKMNYLIGNSDVDLLGLGIEIGDWYFTVGISNHIMMQVAYPYDVVSLKDGNWDVNSGTAIPINLNNIGVDATAWNSIGVSASREISDGFRLGARIKYLNGMANVNTRKSTIELNTTSDPITLDARVNYKVNSSVPVTLGFGSNGLVNNVDFSPAMHNLVGNYIFNGNRGLSIDGGLVYDLDEATQLSASFTDLGFIWWTGNVNNFTGDGSFVFEGIDIDQYVNDPNQDDLLEALSDSLLNSFTASADTKSYITATPINLYGGITRQLMPNLKAGAMTWIEINSMQVRPSLTLSLNFTPFRAFAATVSYTLMNRKFDQIGAGLAFGNRGAQFYILTDNIPVRFTKDVSTSLIWPYNARMLCLRLGLNLFFGCDEVSKESGKGGGKSAGRMAARGSMPKKHLPKSKPKNYCPAYY